MTTRAVRPFLPALREVEGRLKVPIPERVRILLELEFDLVLLLPREKGYRVRRKAEVTIDGEVTVRLSLEVANDPFSVLIQVTSAETEAAKP